MKPEALMEAERKMAGMIRNIQKAGYDIEQTCGKALGYPWYKDDQANFPGATEKNGVYVGEHTSETIVAELAKRYTEALDRIRRLEEAGDALERDKQALKRVLADMGVVGSMGIGSTVKWDQAKEAKL